MLDIVINLRPGLGSEVELMKLIDLLGNVYNASE
jgi:hypothetical protein